MTARPRSHRFLENVSWNLLKQVLGMLFSFFLTPVLVHRLGDAGYGMYSLIWVVLGYFATLSLGAGTAGIRFFSEASAVGDIPRLRDTLRQTLLFHTALPIIAGMVLWFDAPLAATFFSIPPGQTATAEFLLRCVAVGAVAFMASQAGTAMLVGLDCFGTNSAIDTLYSLGLLGGSAALARLGYGLREIGLWFAGVHIVYAVACLTAGALALAKKMQSPGLRSSSLSFKEFGGYALPLFVGQFVWVLNFQTDKVFIATLLPLAALTYYTVPFQLVARLETVPRSVAFAAFQMSSELHGLGQADAIRRLYLKGTKLLWLTIMPALVLLFVFAPQFFTLWLGPKFSDHGTWPLRILLVSFGFYFLSQLPLQMAQGVGKPYYPAVTMAVSAAVAFCTWAVFIPRFGILAAAAGFGLGQLVASTGLLFRFHRTVVSVRALDFIHESLLVPFSAGGLLLFVALLGHVAADSWLRLTGMVAGGLFLYYAAAYFLLDSEEKALVHGMIRRRLGASTA